MRSLEANGGGRDVSLPLADGVEKSLAAEAADRLRSFRGALYGCMGRRADELFELTDALLCAGESVRSLVGLCLAPGHRRGHGALYDALNHGSVDADRLRTGLAGLPIPRMFDGRIVLAVDATPWLRPDAPTCPERLFCHVYGRGGHRDAEQQIPGWPYQLIVACESGPTSWTAALDVVRLGPAEDATGVTAGQLRAVVGRLRSAGHWRPGDPAILVVLDSGYDVHRLAFILADLPLQLIGRIRADRVLLTSAPPRRHDPRGGRPRRHGAAMTLADPGSWPPASAESMTETARYGTAAATSWNRMHPRLTHRGPWAHHPGRLPIVEGTLIRLQVDHLPGQRQPKPVWLWTSATGADAAAVICCWQAYLRRFDLEHTIRAVQTDPGLDGPQAPLPQAADRWTWLVIAAYTQLRLARPLAADLRRPWERPLPPERLTPARVRRGFRYLRRKTIQPASAPKPSHPGPGRPLGSRNRHRATCYDVGKTVSRDTADTSNQQVRG